MKRFEYRRVSNVDDASQILTTHPDAKLLAGGMSLIPMLKLRLAEVSHLIDLGEISDLTGIELRHDSVIIRAMTTHATVAASKEVKAAIPSLAGLAAGIGDPHCRNRGTIGGSIAHNDPAACYPAGVLALNATVQTNRRHLVADHFFKAFFQTALEPGEIITSIKFPIPTRAAYIKFPQPASRFSLVGIFVAESSHGVRVAATGCGPTVYRIPGFEAALERSFKAEALEGFDIPVSGLTTDLFGDAEYRAHLIKVLTKRAVEACQHAAP
jgi:carbon-monoxide dehydrogenase medium subunit